VIYVDNSSTTQIAREVVEAMSEAYQARFYNPSSQHQAGQKASRRLDDARDRILELLGAETSQFASDRLLFTSGGTESNNLALFGLAKSRPGQTIVSAIEHPSIAEAADMLEKQGTRVARLRVSVDGVVDLNHLKELLDQPTRLVSVMLGNNETGVLQPIDEISELCCQNNVPLHVDAVQAIGKIPVSFRRLPIAAMTVSPHKFHGPRGIGGLMLRNGVQIEPILFGGSQQLAARPGTECVELAIGFETALAHAMDQQVETEHQLQYLRDAFESQLLAQSSDIVVNGQAAGRLPHISNVALLGLNRQALVMALDMVGVACSTGSACASGSSEPSPTLLAMGLSAENVEGSLRFSFGRFNTIDEVSQIVGRILKISNNLRQSGGT